MALPGLGPLQETLEETNRRLAEVLGQLTRLEETNSLLAAVLDELRRTNERELDKILGEVRDLNRHLGGRRDD